MSDNMPDIAGPITDARATTGTAAAAGFGDRNATGCRSSGSTYYGIGERPDISRMPH